MMFGIGLLGRFLRALVAGVTMMALGWHMLGAAPATAVLCCVDGSGSANEARVERYLGYLDGVVDVLPPRSRVHLFRFDHEVRELYNAAPRKTMDVWSVQDRELRQAARQRGTRTDLMLERACLELERAPEPRLGLVLVMDGENTGAPLDTLVQKLDSQERLQAVLVLGVISMHRSQLRDQLAPLGRKLILCGQDDVAEGVREFRTLLQDTKEVHHG